MASGKYNAKVRARGLDNTGVTEDVARDLFSAVGSGKATIAIVELEPVRQINEATGDHKVELTLGFVEVAAPGSRADDVLREVARGLYRDRRAAAGETLPGTEEAGERSTDDALTGAEALIERDADGKAEGIWDGDTEEPPVAPPEEHEPQLAGPGADDPSYEPHTFMPGTSDPTSCAVADCGQREDAAVHQVPSDA